MRILFFLLLSILVFSEPIQLDTVTYYNYFGAIREKPKVGMEIQKVKGYCSFPDNSECYGALNILKYSETGTEIKNIIKKIDINLSDYSSYLYENVKINNGYLSFDEKSQVMLDNEIKKKIKKIREMLLIHKKIKNISTDRKIIIPDHPQFYEDEGIKRIFSNYIVIRMPELSPPYTYVLDYEAIKNEVQNYKKYEGRNLNELSQYLKQFLSKNKNKDNQISEKKYDEFMKQEIYETNFYSELNREIVELFEKRSLN